jgi:ribosomal-protein-alanine N-acetyltransferase
MALRPVLQTTRLQLRPFVPDDAPWVQRWAADPEVALPTMGIPHPYPDGAAERWIAEQALEFDSGRGLTLAIVSKEGHELVGSISLVALSVSHRRAELGY